MLYVEKLCTLCENQPQQFLLKGKPITAVASVPDYEFLYSALTIKQSNRGQPSIGHNA